MKAEGVDGMVNEVQDRLLGLLVQNRWYNSFVSLRGTVIICECLNFRLSITSDVHISVEKISFYVKDYLRL